MLRVDDPNRSELAPAHANQGIALAELRRYDEAIESLHRAIALQLNYLDAINALGLILNERGRCDEATDMHTRAAVLQPDGHEHVSNLGGVLIAQGKIPEAIAFYRDAMGAEFAIPSFMTTCCWRSISMSGRTRKRLPTNTANGPPNMSGRC